MDQKEENYEPCRFCNGLTDLLVPICSNEGLELELETKIARHLPVHIDPNDSLPKGICYPCVDVILTWDSFVTTCVDNDASYRAQLEVAPVCDVTFDDIDFGESDDEPLSKIVKLDLKVDVEDDGLTCKSCKKQFKGKKSLTAHARFCNNKERYQCDLCGQEYKTQGFLKKHKQREHDEDNKCQCPVCHIEIGSRRLVSHLKTMHSVKRATDGEPRFKCKYCGEAFRSKYSRNDHIKDVHLNETIKCDVCNFEGLRPVVKRHRRSVHAEKKFPCSLCKLSFKTLHLLKTHMTAHSDLRQYTCDICGMGFKRLNNVRDHMICHQQKSNQCQICGNFFARKRYLAIHEKTIHNFYADGSKPEEKGFECVTCGAKLKWKKNLLAHMRIHTGEKPYFCKICGKSFICHGSLRTHMSKHDLAQEGGGPQPDSGPPSLFPLSMNTYNSAPLHLHNQDVSITPV